MDSYEKITTGINLAGEGMAEIITMWSQELVKTAQKLVCAIRNEDDIILAQGYFNGLISDRAYSVATRDKGRRRRKKWVNHCRKKLGRYEKD